jgi:hypothetical protein
MLNLIRIISFVNFLKSVEKCENEKRKTESEVLSRPRADGLNYHFCQQYQIFGINPWIISSDLINDLSVKDY